MKIKRHHSAMKRHKLSRPMRLAMESGAIRPDHSVFDYGCGLGGDVWRLRQLGYVANGFDPYYKPTADLVYSDVVTCLFVLDVIEDVSDRIAVLKKCWMLSRDHLVLSVRMDGDIRKHGVPYKDGRIRHRTFQRGWRQGEFRDFVENTLQQRTYLIALGVVVLTKINYDDPSYTVA